MSWVTASRRRVRTKDSCRRCRVQRIEGADRLIQQHDPGPHGEGGGHPHPLLLAAGQLVGTGRRSRTAAGSSSTSSSSSSTRRRIAARGPNRTVRTTGVENRSPTPELGQLVGEPGSDIPRHGPPARRFQFPASMRRGDVSALTAAAAPIDAV